jgi:MoaA/NifB/PqqE/SkfB family radical SAM enzyme
MCPQDHHSNVSLDFQILKNNINWQDVQEIVLQGGEVLAQNSGKELFLHLTQQLNKKVDIVTNGTLIDERWADFLVQGCNTVVISVNAATKAVHEKINVGSDYDKVINNIFKLINLKRLYNSHVKIKFRFTIVPENIEEIADAIILSSDLGCDQIQFGYDISTIAYLKENLKIKNELYKKISSILKVENMDKYVDVSRLQYLGLL